MFLGLRKLSEFNSFHLFNLQMKFPYHLEVLYMFSKMEEKADNVTVVN